MQIQSGNSRSERVVNPPRDAMIPARIFLRANDLTSSSLRRVLSSERAGIKGLKDLPLVFIYPGVPALIYTI